MKDISVVINARLGSSRVPKKLIRDFGGSTLIDIALAKLDAMSFFNQRYLAVAEEELKQRIDNYKNISIIERKKEAVAPGVNQQKVTFAHYLEIPTEYIFVFNPCLPFIKIETIKNAYLKFQETSYDSYTSVIPTRDWVFDAKGNALTNSDPRNLTTNQGQKFYKAAHAFHIINRKNLANNGYHWTFTPNDPHLIEIPQQEAVDVDEMIEFEFAEFAYKKLYGL
jgi:CMP-N-acetylneuraminic acid synthetase